MEQQILQQILLEIKEVKGNQEGLNEKVDRIYDEFTEKFEKVYSEFDKVYAEFDKVYAEFDKVYEEIKNTECRLNDKIDKKTAKLNKKIKKLDKKLTRSLSIHGKYILEDVASVSDRLDNVIEKNNLAV